jgi:hypothetical protein
MLGLFGRRLTSDCDSTGWRGQADAGPVFFPQIAIVLRRLQHVRREEERLLHPAH